MILILSGKFRLPLYLIAVSKALISLTPLGVSFLNGSTDNRDNYFLTVQSLVSVTRLKMTPLGVSKKLGLY